MENLEKVDKFVDASDCLYLLKRLSVAYSALKERYQQKRA
jgi:hypothetical protein